MSIVAAATGVRRVGDVSTSVDPGDARRAGRGRPRRRPAPPDPPRDAAAAARPRRRRPRTGTRRRRQTGIDVFDRLAAVWPRFRRRRPQYGFAQHQLRHHLAGHLDRAAAALGAADRVGRAQRQSADRLPAPGPGGHHRLHRRRRARAARGAVPAAGLGAAQGRAARGALRDAAAALGGGRPDDLPGWSMEGRGAQEGRTALAGAGRHPHRRAAHRPAADLVLRPGARRAWSTRRSCGDRAPATGVGVRQRAGRRPGRLDPRRRGQRAGLLPRRGRRVRRRPSRCRATTCCSPAAPARPSTTWSPAPSAACC